MSQTDRVFRPLAAVGLVGAPLLVLVLPPLLTSAGDHASAQEQFTALAGGPAEYGGMFVQAAGALCLVLAAVGVLAVVTARRRGRVPGGLAASTGVVGAGALLLVLGVELTQAFVVAEGTDPPADVALALAINDWPLFGWLLGVGIVALLLTLFCAALALWRTGLVRGVVPAAFVAALLTTLIPMSDAVAAVVPSVCLLLPSAWLAFRLLRPAATAAPVTDGPAPVGAGAPAT
ncbi:hypothetical protein SAMN05660464_3416 [Geodermatophilus dictyosporus]|uniref:DUF4386 family protein n=1 Tax=Geodermatophilus dictyosporus TaxID=1523247 RepID=A0A1I5R0M4_9ACTN|nr:hypothetical protein [Geodermatophilus dictyosporus]SFP52104.1 hypothetical protein SAMN05660464_3416 [Geodermatophilus dictyosporus]